MVTVHKNDLLPVWQFICSLFIIIWWGDMLSFLMSIDSYDVVHLFIWHLERSIYGSPINIWWGDVLSISIWNVGGGVYGSPTSWFSLWECITWSYTPSSINCIELELIFSFLFTCWDNKHFITLPHHEDFRLCNRLQH